MNAPNPVFSLVLRCLFPVVLLWGGLAQGELGLRILDGDFLSAVTTEEGLIASQLSGGLVHSADGGLSFSFLQGTEQELLGLGASGQTVIAVGRNGLIYRSTDGGLNWVKIESEVIFRDLVAVASNGQGIWVAVGTDGLVSRSTDGGQTWQNSTLESVEELSDVIWLSGSTQFLAVGESALFKGMAFTSSSGVNWSSVTLPDETPGLHFAASDDNHSILVGGREGLLLRSDPGKLEFVSVGGVRPSESLTIGLAVETNLWWVGGEEGLLLTVSTGDRAEWIQEPIPGVNPVQGLNRFEDIVLISGQFSDYPWENMEVEFEPLGGGQYRLRLLNARLLHQYRVEISTDLQSWSTVSGTVKVADTNTLEWILTPPATGELRFYRVRLN